MKDKLLKLLENSYSVYSHFPVAAIVVAKDGREFNGVNVEDGSYRAGACAERVAIFSAITAGCKKGDLKEINIMTSNTNKIGVPCGTCRQMIYEMFEDDDIIRCFAKNGDFKEYKVRDLCPEFFGYGYLGE